jgi:hypothetical protein
VTARQRKNELERLNEQLRKINTSLRKQARAGTLYAPGLTYIPPGAQPATGACCQCHHSCDTADPIIQRRRDEMSACGCIVPSQACCSHSLAALIRSALPFPARILPPDAGGGLPQFGQQEPEDGPEAMVAMPAAQAQATLAPPAGFVNGAATDITSPERCAA